MYLSRTLIKDEVLTEFVVPEEGTDKVIIIATGAPGYPNQTKTAFWLAKQGFAVFVPRYRGSWESKGEFLMKPPEEDIRGVIDSLESFNDIFGKEYSVDAKQIIVIGISFGGPAALFSALDGRVSKVLAISPVVDWTAKSEDEPFDVFRKLMGTGFGGAYRMSDETFNKLEKGELYNPVSRITELKEVGQKISIIHAEDDGVVLSGPIKEFSREVGCKVETRSKGGHVGLGSLTSTWFGKRNLLKRLKY